MPTAHATSTIAGALARNYALALVGVALALLARFSRRLRAALGPGRRLKARGGLDAAFTNTALDAAWR